MLRLLLVYGATCAVVLEIARRKVRPISLRARFALLLLPLLLTGRAIVTGGYYGPLNLAYSTPPLSELIPEAQRRHPELSGRRYDDGILSDLQIAIVPWRKAVRDSIKQGRVPLLNRFILSGDPLLGSLQPAPFYPGTFIGFLLPLATAWTFNGAFALFLAALFSFLLAREMEVREPCALFSGAVAMLAGFVAFWCEWPLGAAFSTFPLLVLGLRRIARGEPRGFSISVAAWLLLLLAGHPESIVHVTASAGLVFLVETLRARNVVRPAARASAAGVLALMLAAPMLLPFLEVLPETTESGTRAAQYAHVKKSLPVAEAARSAVGAVWPGAHGSMWSPSDPLPPRFPDAAKAFVGGLAFALAWVGAASRRKDAWILGALALLCFSVAMGVPVVTDALSRLPLFDVALNARLVAITALAMAVMAGMGLEALIDRPGVSSAVLAGVTLGVLFVARSALRVPDPTRKTGAGITLLLLGAPALLLVLSRAVFSRRPALVVALAMGLFLASHLAEMPVLYPTFPSDLFYPAIPEIDALPRRGEPYRTTAVAYDLVPNQSALYELEDPRGYQAMNNARYQSTYGLWCVPQPVWFNRIDDLTRPFLSLLNVRFAIATAGQKPPPGWREYRSGPRCEIFENSRVLPRAFAPAAVRFVADSSRTVEEMAACADFSRIAWIEDRKRAGSETANGSAQVTTVRRGTDLDIEVTAKERSWIVVSQTFWKGWQAREGGRRLPLYFADQAFLAFEVEPGSHRIELVYRPRSFEIGLALSAAGCLILLIAGFVSRRSRRSPQGFRRIAA